MKTTCGIFLFNRQEKFLIGHVTGHKNDIWSIPKGLKDPGEEDYDAAIRELWEETNIDYSSIESNILSVHDLGIYEYRGWVNGRGNKRKQLSAFLVDTDIDFLEWEIKCESMVTHLGDPFPEIDDFKWVTLQEGYELLHQSQIRFYRSIVNVKNNLDL